MRTIAPTRAFYVCRVFASCRPGGAAAPSTFLTLSAPNRRLAKRAISAVNNIDGKKYVGYQQILDLISTVNSTSLIRLNSHVYSHADIANSALFSLEFSRRHHKLCHLPTSNCTANKTSANARGNLPIPLLFSLGSCD